MSRSFRDSLKMVMEGAKEKTSDGMTPDAKHFRQDLHKVQDAGMKHLVQKDSETADYEKVFKGNVDKAPARLADSEPGQDVEKYVEYNEHLEIEEAKKAKKSSKMCAEGCVCEDCSKGDGMKEETISERAGVAGSATGVAQLRQKQNQQAVQKIASTPNPNATAATGMQAAGAPKSGYAGMKPVGSARLSDAPKDAAVAKLQATRAAVRTGPDAAMAPKTGMVAAKPKVKAAPVKPVAKPVAPKPTGALRFGPSSKGADKASEGGGATFTKTGLGGALKSIKGGATLKTGGAFGGRQGGGGEGGRKGGGGGKNESVEIEVNGQLYDISEAHAAAIAAFVEKHGLINEGTAGEFISKEMKTPEKLTAKGKKQKIKQALAIFYSKKRRGENP